MTLARDLWLDLRQLALSALDPVRREQLASELRLLPTLLGRTVPGLLSAKRASNATLARFVAVHAAERPRDLALLSREEELTFAELERRVTAVARALVARGLGPGRRVALVGSSSPTYLAFVLGAARAGIACSLISPSLHGPLFERALAAVPVDLVLVEEALGLALPDGAATYGAGRDFDACVAAELDQEFEPARVEPGADYVYIFTSGTTGFPKACRVTHERALVAATTFGQLVMRLAPGDRVYAPLSLHHSSALLLGAGSCLVAGVPFATRCRFSASEFLDDVRRFDATVMLYIGELCRALLARPADHRDRDHRLRLALGNGLAPDVWPRFVSRYGVSEIREFYGATDVPSAIVNLTSAEGSVGHVPFCRTRGFRLARLDRTRTDLERTADGRAIPCAPDEPGELLIRIRPSSRAELGDVPVYTEVAASRARVIRDVFEPGDRYYRTFDHLACDRHGYFRFVARASESFRFKGENVSCAEVEAVLGVAPGVAQVAVTGVAVPGVDGNPALAAIVPSNGFEWSELFEVARRLPDYAQPRFARLVERLPLGETHKVVRRELAEPGVDPERVAGIRVRTGTGYERLTSAAYAAILAGQARL